MRRFKDFCSKTTRVSAAVSVTIFKTVIEAGSNLLFGRDLPKYLGERAKPYAMPFALFVMVNSIVATIISSGPANWRQFRKKPELTYSDSNHDSVYTLIEEPEVEQTSTKVLTTLLVNSGRCSAVFSSLNAYLGTMVFLEFLYTLAQKEDLHENKTMERTAQAFAALCFLANIVNFTAYKLKRIELTAKKMSTRLTQSRNANVTVQPYCNPALIKAFTFSAFPLTSSFVLALTSTSKALDKLGLHEKGNYADLNLTIAALSSITSLISLSTAELASFYDYLAGNQPETHEHQEKLSHIELLVRILYYSSTFSNLIVGKGLSIFLSFVNKLQQFTKIDSHSEAAITLGLACAISTVMLYTKLTVPDSYHATLYDYYRNNRRALLSAPNLQRPLLENLNDEEKEEDDDLEAQTVVRYVPPNRFTQSLPFFRNASINGPLFQTVSETVQSSRPRRAIIIEEDPGYDSGSDNHYTLG